MFQPGVEYFFKAALHSPEGLCSQFSEPVSFTMPNVTMEHQIVDLGDFVNADLILNEGDALNDRFDLSSGFLIEDGHRGSKRLPGDEEKLGDGMPRDGIIGLHQIADYDDFNAIQFTDEFLADNRFINMEPAQYFGLRLLTASGNQPTRVTLELHYQDDSTDQREDAVGDWFSSPFPDTHGDLPPNQFPILKNMDREYRDYFEDANTANLFEIYVHVDPNRTLKKIRFKKHGSRNQGIINLFSIVGMKHVATE
jgi:hypothetical protein